MPEQLNNLTTLNLLTFKTLLEGGADVAQRRNCDKASVAGATGVMSFTKLLIVNGRTPGDSAGEYTYTSPQGQSVVDYFVVSAQHSSAVADMTVMHSTAIFHIICPMTVRSRITSLFSLICHAALTHLALLPVVLHHNPALATSF